MQILDKYISRLDKLIALGTQTALTADKNSDDYPIWVNEELFQTFKTSGLQCLKDLFGVESIYYEQFKETVAQETESATYKGRGILSAAKTDIQDGWYYSIKSLVTSEIFTDFISMAEYFLNEGYKDAAAVILGGILEEHLRQLSTKNAISLEYKNSKGEMVPKKADTINADLSKANVYNSTDQKQIINWLGLRNDAAHGDYDKYKIKQIVLFHEGLKDFLERVPI